jgi:hypothetical protein
MTREALTLVWVAGLSFSAGWMCCRLKDVVSWAAEKRRREGP